MIVDVLHAQIPDKTFLARYVHHFRTLTISGVALLRKSENTAVVLGCKEGKS